MLSKPILMVLIAAVGTGIIVSIFAINAYTSSFPKSEGTDEGTSPEQEQQENRIVIPQRHYPHEIWAQTSTGDGEKPVMTTFTLTMCAVRDVQDSAMVAGADSSNPIVLKKNGQEVNVAFCATSFDREAITWELMARDPLMDYLPDYKGALEEGVNVSFDKAALQMTAYTWNRTVSENPDPLHLEQFNIYISADENTKLGGNGFQVLAIRHIDDNKTVQIQATGVNIKVVEE